MDPEVDSSDPEKVKVLKGHMIVDLEQIFSHAIKVVVDLGFDKNMVEAALARKSIYLTGDRITNIALGTLLNLNGEGSETTLDIVFPNLQKLVEYTLDEMVCIHRKKSPSTLVAALGELSCDLNGCLNSFKGEYGLILDTPMPDEKNAQLSKLLSRAQELQVEVEGWNDWEDEKVMPVADKLRTYQIATKVLKKSTEAYRTNWKTWEANTQEKVSDEVQKPMENNEKKHRSAASRISVLEARRSLLEKALEAANSLLLSERFPEIHQEALEREQEHIQKVQSLVEMKGAIQYKLEEERKKLSLVKEKIETEEDRLARNEVKLQDERANTVKVLARASLKSKVKEYEELEKGRRALEEKVKEKISEGQNAMKNHKSQLDELASSILTLEKEMSSVENGLEDAKLYAENSTADRQQVRDREQAAIQQTESLALEISLLLEKLKLENSTLDNLQQEIDNGKNLLANNEDRVKEERARREKFLTEATVLIQLREQQEALMKAEEDAIREKAADERQEYAKSIAKIEKEVSMLRGHD